MRNMQGLPGRLINRRSLVMVAGGVLAVAALSVAPAAETFQPSKPITLIVPFAAGGGTDVIARDLAESLRQALSATVIVENRGGGGGLIAAQSIVQAAPDGHTIMLATSTFVTAAAVGRKLPYDILTDFTPVAMLGRGPMVIVVNKDIGIDTLPQLIERLKAKPGELNFVSSGVGSVTHLAGELFLQRTKTKMTHLAYRGSGPAVTDLLGGSGQVFFATIPTILGQIQSKAVKLLAVTGKSRSALFPDTPTAMELGVRDYDVGTWWGVIGPKGMAKPVVEALNAAVNKAAVGPALKKRFHDEGAEPFAGGPDEFADILKAEFTNWRAVVQESGLKID
jgi:tripartite-type tricarboxylate transporter receptor subunit TctC